MSEYKNTFNKGYSSYSNGGYGGPRRDEQDSRPRYDNRQSYGNKGNYQDNNYHNNKGSWGNRGNYSQNNNWKGNRGNDKPVDPDPYVPVTFFSNPEPPLDVINMFKRLSHRCKELGFTIRVAGGNSEADDAARDNAGEKMEEYLPWKGYEGRESSNYWSDESSIEQACKFHPAADKLKDAAKKFLSRNLRMMQGKSLKSPSKMLVIWTEDGASKLAQKNFKTGPAGHFLSIAAGTKTPVFNLGNKGTFDALMEYLEPEKEPEIKKDRQESNRNYDLPNPNRESIYNKDYRNQDKESYNERYDSDDRNDDDSSDFEDLNDY